MQRFLSYLIVFIISVFPIVNASAVVPSCENMMGESMPTHTMSTVVMADIDNAATMSAMGDCCEVHKVVCDHENSCDCDNSQVNYSAVPSIKIAPSEYIGSFKPRYISSLFHSKPSDSLYRPPIDILI